MTQRRICYLITELDPGGAEKALVELATRLDRDRYAVAVGSLTDEGPMADRLRDAGVAVFSVGMRHAFSPAGVWRLRRELKARRPDLLHTFLFHANLAGRLVGRWAGVPLILNSVRVEEQRRSHLLLDRWTHGLADLEACVSESTRRFTAEQAGVPEEKLVVVPNGIDPAPYDTLPPPPADWGPAGDAPVIAFIGRLDAQKDPLALLNAAAEVVARFPNTRFVLAGDGPLRGRVERCAAALGLADNVTLLGRIDDVRPLLGRCLALALPSIWEGMPNVVLEAMAAARPTVATDVGGSGELIVDGETGRLVPPDDPHALAAALCDLLADPAHAQQLGRAARRRVEAHFSIDRTVAAWTALYDRLFATLDGADRA